MTAASSDAWWSERLLEALEASALRTRLSRGRAAAKRGAVVSMQVKPGVLEARVRDVREEPYTARLTMRPASELAWARIEIALAEQALHTAHLLAGVVPHELQTVFEQAGSSLLPRSGSDLRFACDCPDWEMPCEHVAAAAYSFAAALAADPWPLLHWRGRDRSTLLDRLRLLRTDGETDAPPAVAVAGRDAAPVTGAARALQELTQVIDPDTVERFWLSPVPLPARPAVLHPSAGMILRQLGVPPASLGGRDLVEKMRLAYDAFAADG